MKGLGKIHEPDHQVLKNIWLSFLPGAKIGVLGLNGSGKSTLLRIMAGLDHALLGRGVPRRRRQRGLPGAGTAARRVQGRARQRGRGRGGHSQVARRLRRHQHEARRGDVARGDGQGPRPAVAPPGQDRRDQRLGPGFAPRDGDGFTAPAARRCECHDALWRRASPRGAVPAAVAVARPAAARRAHEPPGCGVGGVARAVPQGLPGHRRGRHARSLLPRQRRRLDSRTRSRQRHPVPGQLHGLARAEEGPPRRRKRRPSRSVSARCSANSTGSACRLAPGRPRARRVSTPTNSCSPKTRTRSSTRWRSTFRQAHGWATSWSKRAA